MTTRGSWRRGLNQWADSRRKGLRRGRAPWHVPVVEPLENRVVLTSTNVISIRAVQVTSAVPYDGACASGATTQASIGGLKKGWVYCAGAI